MQNKAHLELEDFEAENLAKLQKMFSRKWEFVFMQAEAQYKCETDYFVHKEKFTPKGWTKSETVWSARFWTVRSVPFGICTGQCLDA